MHHEDVVGVIHKCRLCQSLRNLREEGPLCPHCFQQGIICCFVEPLVLQDLRIDRTIQAAEDEVLDASARAQAGNA